MEWYKISTVPFGRPVLVTDGKYIVACKINYKDSSFGLMAGSFGFGGHDWEWDFEEKDLTHWTELPELPKAEIKEEKLFKNKARCRKCGSVIESKYVHDFVACSCNSIFVDGGNDYWRFGGLPENFERILEPLEVKDR